MRGRGALVLAALLLSACGSTVQVRGSQLRGDGLTQAPGGAGGEGLGGVGGDGAVPGTGGAGGTAGSGGGPVPGPTGQRPQGQPGGQAGTPLPGGGGRGLTAGKGYTAKEIRIGFSISSDAARALGATGLGVQIADQKQLVNTWLSKVNAEGGIAGRKAVPVFFDYSAAGDVTIQDQTACTKWTQDTRVFAATGVRAGVSGSGDNLTSCLAAAGVPWLAASGDAHKWSAYFSAMYSTAEMSRTREEKVLVESLAGQGFFGSGAKVGVVINDTQADMQRAVKEGMEPALARLGLKITRRVVISNPQTESSNAELQMFTSGVTHVLFAAPGGAAASQFMISAESQQRTYHYGISTQDAPGLTVQALVRSERQLKNAVGYGYRPSLDVDANNQPPETPGMKSCFDFYRSKGFDTGSLNRAGMALICDSVNLLQEALQGQSAPSQAGFAQAVAALQNRLPVASTFTSAFSTNQHDGIGSYRFLHYESGCTCFRYFGSLRATG